MYGQADHEEGSWMTTLLQEAVQAGARNLEMLSSYGCRHVIPNPGMYCLAVLEGVGSATFPLKLLGRTGSLPLPSLAGYTAPASVSCLCPSCKDIILCVGTGTHSNPLHHKCITPEQTLLPRKDTFSGLGGRYHSIRDISHSREDGRYRPPTWEKEE